MSVIVPEPRQESQYYLAMYFLLELTLCGLAKLSANQNKPFFFNTQSVPNLHVVDNQPKVVSDRIQKGSFLTSVHCIPSSCQANGKSIIFRYTTAVGILLDPLTHYGLGHKQGRVSNQIEWIKPVILTFRASLHYLNMLLLPLP